MTRRVLSIAATLLSLFFAVFCQAGDKYQEAREVFEEYVPAMERYLDAVDKVQKPHDLAGAINEFADSMEKIAPKMKSLAEKYPELQTEESAPPEYADLERKSTALGERFAQSFMRIAPFMEDPEVEKANERLMEVMGEMGE